MSATLEFLQSVLPNEGYYCLARPYPNGGYGHQTFETVEQLAAAAQAHSQSKTDIFFAVGSLKERKVVDDEGKTHVRTHANMLAHKSLFVDLDCGATKDYSTQADALKAIKAFCDDSGWFLPTYALNSGRGIHAYWVFDEQVTTVQWKQLADRFKVITKHFGLKADPVCTSDKARVLRVPGTFNWKNPDDPKPVEILRKGIIVPKRDMEAKLNSLIEEHGIDFKARKDDSELPEHIKKLFADKVSNLRMTQEVSIEPIYQGCAQMARIREIGGPVGYGLRSCAASIIKLSKEQDYSVLWANDPNPELVESQTHNMIVNSVTDNPSTCERFESFNPEGCKDCLHKGKIKSPIRIGTRTLDYFNEDDVKLYEERKSASELEGDSQLANSEISKDLISEVVNTKQIEIEGTVYNIHKPPKNYKLIANGHVVNETVDEDGVAQQLTVADFTIFPVRLFKGVGGTDMVMVYAKCGIEHPISFNMSMRELASNDSFKKALSGHSLFPPGGEKSTGLYNYMISYIKHLQSKTLSTNVEMSLGWADDSYSKFVTPDSIITKDGERECFIDDTVKSATSSLKKKGSFEEWKSVIDFYAQEGYEDYAFGHLTAYGSLVFPFSGHSGAIISMIGQSGSGKSTILKSINSVYGEPKNYLTKDGTPKANMNRLSTYRNYCVTYDEITNIDPMELSNLAYSVSQGKPRLKLTQNSTEVDTRGKNWQLIMACTGNANLSDRLSSQKLDASAETLRIFEYYVHRRDTIKHSEAREIFEKKLDNNYGHAGDIFIKFMVHNVDKIQSKFDQVLRLLEEKSGAGGKERFWLAIATANIVGGLVAKDLGLHSFDMNKIFNWVVDKLREMQGVVTENTRSPAQVVSEFINNSANKALVLHGGVQDKSGKTSSLYPTVEPSDQLWVRIEADRGLAFIDRNRIREYLTKGGSDYNQVKGLLLESGVLASSDINKVLSAGSNKAKSGSTKCWVVRLNHKEMAETVVIPTGSDNVVKLEGTEAA